MTAPTQPAQLVQIEKPVYGGSFLARVEGQAVFVPLALPGEEVRIRIVERKRSYATAEIMQIVSPAPQRIAPACPHFGSCGGCHYQHTDYATQLQLKQAILRETFDRAGVPAPAQIDLLSAQPWGYRNRIRLAFDAHGNPGYRGRRSHAVIPISECPIAAPLLIHAAHDFARAARGVVPNLRFSEVVLFCNADETALQASVFVASAFAKQAKSRFDELARTFAEAVSALRGMELVAEVHANQPPRTIVRWGSPSLEYNAAGFSYRVDHGAFFQVNRFLVDTLVEHVAAGHRGALAWDLFAGVGLFARRLAGPFRRVVAVESAPLATSALAHNLAGTGAEAVNATTLNFLRHSVKSERPDLIVLDPPRTGLGTDTTSLLAAVAAPAIVYVSCDPATLARDLRALIDAGYELQSVTLADLFPQTFHLETVVQLRRA